MDVIVVMFCWSYLCEVMAVDLMVVMFWWFQPCEY